MNTSLQQRIQSADLTRTEKRIADYFLDHSESLYFMTARDIAQELGVSDTSIIRLCRALGYRGFRELQESQRELQPVPVPAAGHGDAAGDVPEEPAGEI